MGTEPLVPLPPACVPAVISYLTTDISKQGLLIIPGIVGQISQIFIGSALARYFAPKCVLFALPLLLCWLNLMLPVARDCVNLYPPVPGCACAGSKR